MTDHELARLIVSAIEEYGRIRLVEPPEVCTIAPYYKSTPDEHYVITVETKHSFFTITIKD